MKEWDELIDKAADGENGKFFPFRMTDTVDGAAERDPLFRAAVDSAVKRFLSGDWGDICPEDTGVNEDSIRRGNGQALGIYPVPYVDVYGRKLWLIAHFMHGDLYDICALFPMEY